MEKIMISYGKNTFFEAIKNNRIIRAYVLEGSKLINNLKDKHIPFNIKNKKDLDKLANFGNHQGIVFEVKDYQTFELEDLIDQQHQLIIMLDGIEDPHNLGAMMRTGDAIGIDGIIYKKHHAVSLSDTVAKVSTGAIEYIKCVEVTNLTKTIEVLKKRGYWIVGLEADGATDYTKMNYDMKICLIIGSEGNGISRLVSDKLDFKVSLPMNGHVNSLNASNAFAIMVYKIFESRHQA